MAELQEKIEERLAVQEPQVEVIEMQRPKGDTLRLFIDHPDGVDLALCERVTRHLGELLQDYSLEVSSPGLDRPLTKPEHFQRFLGQQARIRTRDPIEGRRSFTGTLAEADERSVRLNTASGAVDISHDEIRRSNLVPEIPQLNLEVRG